MIVAKSLAQRNDLTAKAKGIMLYMLSKPNDWQFYESDISNHFKDGISSIRSAIKELIANGFIQRTRERDANGRLGKYAYSVYENNILNKTYVRDSKVGSSNIGSPTPTNNDNVTNNDNTNNKGLHQLQANDAYISFFLTTYKESFGEEHRLSTSDGLCEAIYEYDIDDAREIMIKFFNTYKTKDRCNIDYFNYIATEKAHLLGEDI